MSIHLLAATAVDAAVRADGLFNWATSQANSAKTAIESVAGVVILIIAIIMLIKFHHSIGKLLGAVVVLVIGAALIGGGIVSALQQQVTTQVDNGSAAPGYSVTRQL